MRFDLILNTTDKRILTDNLENNKTYQIKVKKCKTDDGDWTEYILYELNTQRRDYLQGMDSTVMDEIADLKFDFTEWRESERSYYRWFVNQATEQLDLKNIKEVPKELIDTLCDCPSDIKHYHTLGSYMMWKTINNKMVKCCRECEKPVESL